MSTFPRLVAAALGVVLMAGCGAGAATSGTASPPPVTPSSSAAPVGPSSTTAAATPPAPAAGRYVDLATYRADPARFEAGRVVLFFHATWCPNCRRTDANLTADPGAIPADLTVVKVDYDSETGLRRTYGVTQQHTFVSVGPDGAERARWTGTDTAEQIAQKAV